MIYLKKKIDILNDRKTKNNPNIIQIIESGYDNIERINHKRKKMRYMILEYAKNRELFRLYSLCRRRIRRNLS